jgi:riboflavin synthase
MFTGIIESTGEVRGLEKHPGGTLLRVDASKTSWKSLSPGESICVSGVCLTLLPPGKAGWLSFDLSEETLKRTTLGDLVRGSKVNLERALTPSSRLGGHFVSGHVDGVGRLAGIKPVRGGREYFFEGPPEVLSLVAEKGSVCVEGVSLTPFGVRKNRFTCALIPTTLRLTNLGVLREGDKVNLEADVLMRYVRRLMEKRS